MKNLSLAKKLSLSFLTVFLVLVFIVSLVNLSVFDEELDPELISLLTSSEIPANRENALYALWGLEAAAQKNIVDTGIALVHQYRSNKELKNHDGLSSSDYLNILGGKNLDDHWKNKIENCVARKQSNCSSLLNTQLHDQPIKSERLELMLARYQQIIAMSKFQQINDHTIASPLPPYGTLMKLKSIHLARILISDNFEEFYTHMQNDLRFWKMLLAQGDSILDKMIAVVSIWSDIHTISEYVTKHKITSSVQLSDLQALLNTLTPEELDIGESFIFEQRAFGEYLGSYADDKTASPLNWLFQPNATINAYNRLFTQKLVQLSAQSSMNFYKTIGETHNGELVCCFKELAALRTFSPSSIYNYGGKLILSTSSFQAQDYIARVHDLNGMLSLVRLKLSLQSVNPSEITHAVSASIERNLYNQQPLEFDSDQTRLGFNCLDKSSVCSVGL